MAQFEQPALSRRRFIRHLAVGAAALGTIPLLQACAPAAPAQPTAAPGAAPATSGGPLPPALAGLTGADKDRVQALIESASKEGEVSWRSSVVKNDTGVALADAFRAYYGLPASFKVGYNTDMSTADLTSKTSAELEANKLAVDIISVGAMAWVYDVLKRGEVMQYDSPVHKDYGPAARAGLTEPGYWVSDAYTSVPTWNTELYPKGLKTWEDVLDPALKGKLIMNDPTGTEVATSHFLTLRSALGRSFYERLAAQKPTSVTRSEEVVAKVISGEYWVAQSALPSRVYQAIQKGAPLALTFPETGINLVPQPWLILAKAAHPNAAKLWIDFIFSDYGQQVYQKGEALISGREGFQPPAEVAKYAPAMDKVNRLPFDWKSYTPEMHKAGAAEFREIMSAAQ